MKEKNMQAEFDEQVSSLLRRGKTAKEGRQALAEYSSQLLKQAEQTLDLLNEYPVYAGVAFVGKFKFVKRGIIAAFIEQGKKAPSADRIIAYLRQEKAVEVAESARATFKLLEEKNVSALWVAVVLNFSTKNQNVEEEGGE